MIKDFILVGIGSFLGGGSRFLFCKLIDSCTRVNWPLGTFGVNIIGCLLIGFLSGLPCNSSFMNPTTRLILTTGFCGGFTTFSTFMNENYNLCNSHDFISMTTYLFASMAIGIIAVVAGHTLGKMI